MKTLPPVHRIALLFNGSKIYDRGIIAGIGNYLSSTRASWDLFLEEDFLCRLFKAQIRARSVVKRNQCADDIKSHDVISRGSSDLGQKGSWAVSGAQPCRILNRKAHDQR